MCIGASVPKPSAPPPLPKQAPQRKDPFLLKREDTTEEQLRRRRQQAQRLFSTENGPLQPANTAAPSLTRVV